MTPPVTSPTVLVTGGARRIGRAIVETFARRNWRIIFTYNTSADDARQLLDHLNTTHPDHAHAAHQLILHDPATIDTAARSLAAAVGPIDALIHNASTYAPSPLAELTPDRLIRDYTVNALAPAILSKHFADSLKQSSRANSAIVALADIHALAEHGLPRKDFLSYAMSKAALVEMVRGLARDLAPHTRVNALALGVAAWPENGYESDTAAQETYLKRIPLARAGTPEQAAEAVRWLVEDATYMTGQIIRLDGGRSML